MWNPGLDRTNRKARRKAAKYNGDPWTKHYNIQNSPIDLGVRQYKLEYPGEHDRHAYYKESMWKAYYELH